MVSDEKLTANFIICDKLLVFWCFQDSWSITFLQFSCDSLKYVSSWGLVLRIQDSLIYRFISFIKCGAFGPIFLLHFLFLPVFFMEPQSCMLICFLLPQPHWNYYTFLVQNFCLVPFYNFCLFINILLLVICHFPVLNWFIIFVFL
jgi:hypothetical protein